MNPGNRIKVSAAIITFNEEVKIRDCLESVTWADEIVVVDSRSADRTVEICREYTDKIIIRDFPGHVEQKNFAVNAASYDWILSLDADERVSGPLRKELLAVISRSPSASGYYIPRKTFYLNRWIEHGGWYPDAKIRFFNRNSGSWGGEDPHDSVICSGKTAGLKGDILHFSFDSIDDHLDTIRKFTAISAGEKIKKGHEFSLWQITLRPVFTFMKMYLWKRGFLDGSAGFVAAVLSSYHVFIKYARIWASEQ
ncbi:MAG: glycosyltransferase family 2 protein [bacterium]